MRNTRGGPLPAPKSGDCGCYNPSVSALLLVPAGTNRHVHEDLGVPLCVDHIRGMEASFHSKFPDGGNYLV